MTDDGDHRRALPLRREARTITIRHYNRDFAVTVGLYKDRTIGEVFVMCDKVGTEMQSLTRDGAILISLALQYGCPLDTMRHAISRNPDDTPASFIGALLDVLTGERAAIKAESEPPEAAE